METFQLYQQKSIAKGLPPNTQLNYYRVLSEHVYCPENYIRQVLDARDELPDSEDAFNVSQMNADLQNMFAFDAAVSDGAELDISDYDKKNKRIWELQRVQSRLLLWRPSLDWKQSK